MNWFFVLKYQRGVLLIFSCQGSPLDNLRNAKNSFGVRYFDFQNLIERETGEQKNKFNVNGDQ